MENYLEAFTPDKIFWILVGLGIAAVVVVMLWVVFRRIEKMPRVRLEDLGLSPAKGDRTERRFSGFFGLFYHSKSRIYEGTYRGRRAGYTEGSAAVTHYVAHDDGIEVSLDQIQVHGPPSSWQAGCEFWVALDLDCPPLVVYNEDDHVASGLARKLVPHRRVTTGDGTFDRHFTLRCADPDWARAVLTDEVRSTLLDQVQVLVLIIERKVIFSLTMAKYLRLIEALGQNQLWFNFDPLQKAAVMLDTALLVARAAEAAA
jgi:hypothetical protein